LIEDLPQWVSSNVLIFCRVGTMLMLLPGYSSVRVPSQIRLFLALAFSFAISPLIAVAIPAPTADQPLAFARVAMSELILGGFLGLQVRIAFEALHFVATLIAQSIGYAGLGGPGLADEGEQGAAFVSLVTMIATVLLFAANLHVRMLLVLVDSYRVLPPGDPLNMQPAVDMLMRRMGETLLLSLRLASPFVVVSILINLCIALINRVSPVIPSFFIAQPLLLFLGLLLFLIAAPDFFDQFTQALAAWIDRI